MGLTSYENVLYHESKDLLSAEKQFRDALPKLAEEHAADKKLERIAKDLGASALRAG